MADYVEIVRDAMAALNEGRTEDALAAIDPEIVWHPNVDAPESEPYLGIEGLRKLRGLVDDAFDDFRLDVNELIACSEGRVLVVGEMKAKGHGSEIEIAEPRAWLFRLRDGLIVEQRTFSDIAQARGEAGLEPSA